MLINGIGNIILVATLMYQHSKHGIHPVLKYVERRHRSQRQRYASTDDDIAPAEAATLIRVQRIRENYTAALLHMDY